MSLLRFTIEMIISLSITCYFVVKLMTHFIHDLNITFGL